LRKAAKYSRILTMAAPTELSVLLRLYSGKQKSPTVLVQDFCDYIQKYARHYLQEVPDLVMYLDDTINTVLRMLEDLERSGKVILSSDSKGRKLVYVPQYFIDRIVQRFKDIDAKIDRPYPLATELPGNFPQSYIKPVYITSDFAEMLERATGPTRICASSYFPTKPRQSCTPDPYRRKNFWKLPFQKFGSFYPRMSPGITSRNG